MNPQLCQKPYWELFYMSGRRQQLKTNCIVIGEDTSEILYDSEKLIRTKKTKTAIDFNIRKLFWKVHSMSFTTHYIHPKLSQRRKYQRI